MFQTTHQLCTVLVLSSVAFFVTSTPIGAQQKKPAKTEAMTEPSKNETTKVEVNEKVSGLFQRMRDGEYEGPQFPELDWNDVPSLLKVAESNTTVKSFPRNPLSSMYYEDATEGEVALWLMEGIRQGGKYPSLNCRMGGTNMDAESNRDWLQMTALDCYQQWWADAGTEPSEESLEINPLAETDPKIFWT